MAHKVRYIISDVQNSIFCTWYVYASEMEVRLAFLLAILLEQFVTPEII